MPEFSREKSAPKRRANKAWWKKQWPWWRIGLAVVFVFAFFGSTQAGIFPSELRTEVPSSYNGYRVLISAAALILFAPLAIGPDWRHQGVVNSGLAVGLLAFCAVIYSWNLVARIYVAQEMSPGYGVTVTPTEFRLHSIEARSSGRGGRHYVANFMSADGVATWRPADADIGRSQIGLCVTLNIRRNLAGAILVEGLDAIDAGSFRRCAT